MTQIATVPSTVEVNAASRSRARSVTRADLVAVLAFVLVAALFQFGRWAEAYPFLYGDAGNVASFAAAWDHPELFVNDNLLGDSGHFRFYAVIHVPLVRWLNRFVGDYAIAFTSLLGPLVLLQAIGFYVFGRVVLRGRWWAFLLSIASLMLVPLNLGTFWGIYRDPISRIMFQALLPFLLAAAYYWRSRPATRPSRPRPTTRSCSCRPGTPSAWIIPIGP